MCWMYLGENVKKRLIVSVKTGKGMTAQLQWGTSEIGGPRRFHCFGFQVATPPFPPPPHPTPHPSAAVFQTEPPFSYTKQRFRVTKHSVKPGSREINTKDPAKNALLDYFPLMIVSVSQCFLDCQCYKLRHTHSFAFFFFFFSPWGKWNSLFLLPNVKRTSFVTPDSVPTSEPVCLCVSVCVCVCVRLGH